MVRQKKKEAKKPKSGKIIIFLNIPYAFKNIIEYVLVLVFKIFSENYK